MSASTNRPCHRNEKKKNRIAQLSEAEGTKASKHDYGNCFVTFHTGATDHCCKIDVKIAISFFT